MRGLAREGCAVSDEAVGMACLLWEDARSRLCIAAVAAEDHPVQCVAYGLHACLCLCLAGQSEGPISSVADQGCSVVAPGVQVFWQLRATMERLTLIGFDFAEIESGTPCCAYETCGIFLPQRSLLL